MLAMNGEPVTLLKVSRVPAVGMLGARHYVVVRGYSASAAVATVTNVIPTLGSSIWSTLGVKMIAARMRRAADFIMDLRLRFSLMVSIFSSSFEVQTPIRGPWFKNKRKIL